MEPVHLHSFTINTVKRSKVVIKDGKNIASESLEIRKTKVNDDSLMQKYFKLQDSKGLESMKSKVLAHEK